MKLHISISYTVLRRYQNTQITPLEDYKTWEQLQNAGLQFVPLVLHVSKPFEEQSIYNRHYCGSITCI